MDFTAYLPIKGSIASLFIYEPNDETIEEDNFKNFKQKLTGQKPYDHGVGGDDNVIEVHSVDGEVVITCNSGALAWAIYGPGKGMVERGIEEPLSIGLMRKESLGGVRSFDLSGGKRLVLAPDGLD